jgi:hypothetical protein
MNLKAQQLKPGLWRWTLPHPDWTPDRGKPGGWGQMVGCVSYEPSDTAEPFILFDPLAPPSGDASEESFWKALDADVQRRGTVAVFLANYFHVRSTQTVRERYRARHGAEVWAQADARSHIPAEMTRTIESAARLPGGVTAHPIAGLMEAEVVYHIPEHRALVVADALIGAGEGRLRVPPARWAEETDEGQRRYHEEFRASLRGLLALPIDMVLVSHGEPVLTGGDRALREALEAPAWGEEPARAIPD